MRGLDGAATAAYLLQLLNGYPSHNYSAVKWLTTCSGLDRNGVAVYIFFCKVGVTPLSWSVSMYTRDPAKMLIARS